MPKFTLRTSQNTTRVEAFFNEKNNQVDPLVLLLKNEKDHTMLLLYGFRLPEPSISNLAAARFLIKIRDPSQNSVQQWLFFTEQFALTQAETRLCRALADGLTLNDCSVNWKVTTNTLRSQLNSIFSKTSTRRQVDLLRLINLFLRT